MSDLMDDPRSPDNMTVRLELVRRVKAGEISLEEAQQQIRWLANERRRMVAKGEL